LTVTCPHCGKDIDLIGTRELREEFHLSDNQIQHARETDQLPEPWLSLENRYLYERGAIEAWIEQRSRAKVEASVKEILAAIQNLPADEQAEARKVLNDELAPKKGARSRG
jgi:hypothetical protein